MLKKPVSPLAEAEFLALQQKPQRTIIPCVEAVSEKPLGFVPVGGPG